MKVLVIFGSTSDKAVYEEARKSLIAAGFEPDVQVLSAHRTPAEVDAIDLNSYAAIIAGAGLAAHLPGVVAARSIRPIIGVPCEGAFSGLDAWLAIVQMPPGTPVLCTPVGKPGEGVRSLAKAQRKIHLVGKEGVKALKKAEDWLEGAGIAFTKGAAPIEGAVNVVFVSIHDELPVHASIICPCQDASTDKDALAWFHKAKIGAWVGLNRGENAAIAAAQLAGGHDAALHANKEAQRKKVLETRYG